MWERGPRLNIAAGDNGTFMIVLMCHTRNHYGLIYVWKETGGQTGHLTHWGRVTHICVSNLIHIGSDNGLSPGRPQAIIWTNAEILLIGLLGTNFSEILIEICIFWFKKMHLKMSSGKWRPFCLGLNVLTHWGLTNQYIKENGSSLVQLICHLFIIPWTNDELLWIEPWEPNFNLNPIEYIRLKISSTKVGHFVQS